MMKNYFEFINENKNLYKYSKIIDYTYLRNDTNIEKIRQICNDAIKYNFYSVCIKSEFVSYAKEFLKNSDVKICTVISFPDGIDKSTEKLRDTEKSIINGADEIDLVMNYKLLKKSLKLDDAEKDNKIKIITKELSDIARICHNINSVILKIIIETGELTLDQIKIACDICVNAGVDYIKTSTGFKKGAEIEKVKFMRKILPDFIKIKASGGIRTLDDIKRFVNAGADRVGTSLNPYLLDY